MDKLKMCSINNTNENVMKIGALFPNCITERIDENGNLEKAIDFDLLKQELSTNIVEGNEERYQFNWPDKKKTIIMSNSPIEKTFRPCREDSVDFENTKNLYIEGDNLEALKLLQETYLGRIKLIYIDPPYNTGSDLVYEDDYIESIREYIAESGQIDDEGNRLVLNNETNGRFHTDWLNMIYPRIRLCKNLLSDDGIIFISINDKEVGSLRNICTEIFGEQNFLATLIWDKNHSAQAGIFKVYHEYVLVYCKNSNSIKIPKSLSNELFEAGAMKKVSGRHPATEFTFPAGTRFEASDGTIIEGEFGDTEKVIVTKGRMIAKNHMLQEEVTLKAGFTQANQMKQYFYGDRESLVDSQGQRIVEFYFNSTGKIKVVKERGVETPQTTCKFGTQGMASTELASLFGLEECPFSSPKPVDMIKDFIMRFVDDGDIVLDFFSGSATTAQAVYEAQANNLVRNINYILVQYPEDLDESLARAHKDAVRTLQVGIEYLDKVNKPHKITEIGKERIRLAAAKVNQENPTLNFDGGFRVLKIDNSNMKDVYYNPSEYDQSLFDSLDDNIKDDRTSEDLLFQVMLELGVMLSSKIEVKTIAEKIIYNVAEGFLVACFDKNVTEELISEVAKGKPYYFVMRDSSLASDCVAANFDQIFATYSPDTVRKVL